MHLVQRDTIPEGRVQYPCALLVTVGWRGRSGKGRCLAWSLTPDWGMVLVRQLVREGEPGT